MNISVGLLGAFACTEFEENEFVAVPLTSKGRRSSRIVIFANMFTAAEMVIPTELQNASKFILVSSSIRPLKIAMFLSLSLKSYVNVSLFFYGCQMLFLCVIVIL